MTTLVLGVLVLAALGVAAGTIQHSVAASGADDGLTGGAEAGGTETGKTAVPGTRDVASDPPEDRTPGERREEATPRKRGSNGGGAGSDSVVDVVTSPVGGLGLLVVLAVLAVAVAISGGGRTAPERASGDDDAEGNGDDAGLAAVGRAAGRAADRMETADPDVGPTNCVQISRNILFIIIYGIAG